MKNLAAELDRDQEFPPSWRPLEGDQIVGVIERYSHGTSSLTGDPVQIVWIEDDQGNRHSVWLNCAVLVSKFADLKPQPGERVGIRYMGKHEAKNYKIFRVVVDRAAAPPAAPTFDAPPVPAEMAADVAPDSTLDDEAEPDDLELTDDDVPF